MKTMQLVTEDKDASMNYYTMLIVNLLVIAINVYLYRLSTKCDVKSRTTFQLWFGIAVVVLSLQTVFAAYQYFKK